MGTVGVFEPRLSPPRLPDAAIRREPLVRRLADAESRLAVVWAPAGFGKTTLARQWAEMGGRVFAWLSADVADDDPVVLFNHLVAALAGVVPMSETLGVLEQGHRVDPERGALLIASDLTGAPNPFLLVIDDVHAVTSSASLILLERLLQSIPEGSVVCLVSRERPPFRLARRQLSGDLVELSVADLAFTADECTEVLRRTLPELDPTVEASIIERCAGWPAAIGLAALSVEVGTDLESLRTGLAATDHIAAYLHEELLDRLPRSDRAFLLRTSVLSRVHSGLCDEMLEQDGSAAVLERLVAGGNLFVVGLDDRGTGNWFRYHPLFRDLLLTELRTEDEAGEAALRRRAIPWLRDHGMVDEAVVQALAAQEHGTAVELIYSELFELVDQGRMATLERWLGAFAVAEILATPELALASAAVAGMAGRADDTTRWMQVVDTVDPDRVLTDGTPAAVGRSAVRLITGDGGAKASADAAEIILELGPTGSPWWALARLVSVLSDLAMDRLDDPIAAFRVLCDDVGEFPVLHSLAAAHWGILELLAGHTDVGRALVEASVGSARLANLGDSPMMAVISTAQTFDAATRRAVEETREHFDESVLFLEHRGDWNARGQIFVRLVLGESAYRIGSYDDAADQLKLAFSLFAVEPDVARLLTWADDLDERLARRKGSPQRSEIQELTSAELRVLAELPSHRSIAEIAERLFVSRNTVKTQAISIYRKLGVSTRSAAVELAQELGLLVDP